MKTITGEALKKLGLDENLPKHVGIIMDGNGRWAQSRGLPRSMGHKAGVERLRGIIRLSSDLGIEALTLYAFSTENWKRPESEKSVLFSLLVEYFNKEIAELHANDVCIRALGELDAFPDAVRTAVRAAESKTANNSGLKLNICLNYGSRAELLRAARLLMEEAAAGTLSPADITEREIENRLYTKDLPMLDLVIRTSGEQRLSNFLMYQAAYAELLFVEDYWPDYSDERYLEGLRTYQKRSRRFGGV
ncbi:MAG: isoprenyl transferase [Eubacteriales bacterium]|nr:isoprenyl transferase [Eubacteriales bacterium]